MRAVVQRVSRAAVRAGEQETGRIEAGMLVLVAATHGDGPADVAWLVDKLAHLRIFEDDAGKMNRSLLDTAGAALVVSQFTLYGDCRKGRRPSFVAAAAPDVAAALIEQVIAGLGAAGVPTAGGRFGARMAVSLENDGPVTIILDSPRSGPPNSPATTAEGGSSGASPG